MGIRARLTRPVVQATPGTATMPGPDPVNGAPLKLGAPGNAAPAVVLDYRQPSPIGESSVRSIDAMYGAANAGELGMIRWGEKSSTLTGHSYGGDLGPLQRFSGAQAAIGSPAIIRNTQALEGNGLPGTSTVPGQPANQILAMLIRNNGYSDAGATRGLVTGG